MRHNWIKHFALLSVLIMPTICFGDVDYVSEFEAYINKPTTQGDKPLTKREGTRILFSPSVAEYELEKHFRSANYDLAHYKWETLTENDKYLSAEDLMSICIWGFVDDLEEDETGELTDESWHAVRDKCLNGFIHDIIETTDKEYREVTENVPVGTTLDLTTKGGPCTPSVLLSSLSSYPDRSVDDGVYCENPEKYNVPAFNKAVLNKLRVEGGCVQSPGGDGMGLTCFGVTEKSHADRLKKENFSRMDAIDVYWNEYYKAADIYKLPDSILTDVLMYAIEAGAGGGPQVLNEILGVLYTEADQAKKPHLKAGTGKTRIVNATMDELAKYDGTDLRRDYWTKVWMKNKKADIYNGVSQGWAKGRILYLHSGCHSPVEEQDIYGSTTERIEKCTSEVRDPAHHKNHRFVKDKNLKLDPPYVGD